MEHVDEDALGADGKPDAGKLDPLILMPGGFCKLGAKLERWH
jgi:hypothetical protein